MGFYDGVPVPLSVRITPQDWVSLAGEQPPKRADLVSARVRKLCGAAVMAWDEGQTWLMEAAIEACMQERGKRSGGARVTVRFMAGGITFLEDFCGRHGLSMSSLVRNIVAVSVPLVPEGGWERDDEHP